MNNTNEENCSELVDTVESKKDLLNMDHKFLEERRLRIRSALRAGVTVTDQNVGGDSR